MPNQPACIPCKYSEAQTFLDRRLSEGADLRTIRSDLNSDYRKKVIGYKKGPSLQMLQTHQRNHRGFMAPVSGNSPSFTDDGPKEVAPSADGDVASAIQKEALAMLERGEMRLTAGNALKAQEMLDRRAEKAADRELTLVLARLMTQQGQPPAALIATEVAIEGEVREVGTADD